MRRLDQAKNRIFHIHSSDHHPSDLRILRMPCLPVEEETSQETRVQAQEV